MQPISSLQPISFKSVREFQRYFQENESLELSSCQRLEIHEFSEGITYDEPCLHPDRKNELERIISVLDRLLLPLAKRISILDRGNGLASPICTIGQSFIISHILGLKLAAKKRDIYTRLDRFFQSMITSSIERVEFSPRQKLVAIQGAKRDWPQGTNDENFQFLVRKSLPLGLTLVRHIKGQKEAFRISTGEIESLDYGEKQAMSIEAADSMTFSLQESKDYTFSEEGFRKCIQLKGINLPAGKTLRILNLNISGLRKEYEKSYPAGGEEFFCFFVFNQMLLPLGKTLSLHLPPGKGDVLRLTDILKFSPDSLEMSPQYDMTLGAEFGELITSLDFLRQSFRRNRTFYLKTQPEQKLTLVVSAEEAEQLAAVLTNKDPTLIEKGLDQFFAFQTPIGFKWVLNILLTRFDIMTPNQSNQSAIKFSGRNLEIGLRPAPPAIFITSLLNDSPKEFIEGIQNSDNDAFIPLLFKAIFYQCSTGLLPPPFFKETSREHLRSMVEDGSFADSLQKIFEKPKLFRKFSQILKMTPEEFKELDPDSLKTPLKEFFKQIIGLAYEELQGGEFMPQCVLLARNGLENGTLNHLLHPHLIESPPSSPAGIAPLNASNR